MLLTYLYAAMLSLGVALIPYFIASKRGASKNFWLVMGLIFGPLAIPFVFFAKTRDAKQEKAE